MSRTKKGSKGSGFEFWSRRPSKIKFPPPGRETKTITHRLERAAVKRDLHKENEDLNNEKENQ
jgi:hypothetical protein